MALGEMALGKAIHHQAPKVLNPTLRATDNSWLIFNYFEKVLKNQILIY
jgi:hypothetical protein